MEEVKKKDNEQEMDPTFISCFEAAMLDYQLLTAKVEATGRVLKNRRVYHKWQRQERWNVKWIMDNYTLVCCKMSTLPRAERDMLEYIGDNAAALWMQLEEEARRRIQKPSNEA